METPPRVNAELQTMKVISIKPEFGVNYDVGYIGFTFTAGSFVSEGIAYFERWERMSQIQVSHVFVVIGDNELVEAHIEHGVQRAPIIKYFDDPKTRVFFRQPRGWNPFMGRSIARAALSKVGTPYATGLIVADLMADSWMGHWLNIICRQWPRRLVNALITNPNDFICSELGAYALASQVEFEGRGCLAGPLDAIDPQDLFEDQVLFEDWVRASGHGPGLQPL